MYSTYARFCGLGVVSLGAGECVATLGQSESRHNAMSRANPGSCFSNSAWVRTTRGFESLRMTPRRAAGYDGSSGTYAPPAFRIPTTPTTSSIERVRHRPTSWSGPTPRPCRCRASWFARTLSSANVSTSSRKITAGACGVCSATRATSSGTLSPEMRVSAQTSDRSEMRSSASRVLASRKPQSSAANRATVTESNNSDRYTRRACGGSAQPANSRCKSHRV